MIILLHVMVALATLAASGWAVVRPSRKLLSAAYALLAATLISGTYLLVTMHAHIVQTCVTGLAFIAISAACLLTARRRLTAEA